MRQNKCHVHQSGPHQDRARINAPGHRLDLGTVYADEDLLMRHDEAPQLHAPVRRATAENSIETPGSASGLGLHEEQTVDCNDVDVKDRTADDVEDPAQVEMSNDCEQEVQEPISDISMRPPKRPRTASDVTGDESGSANTHEPTNAHPTLNTTDEVLPRSAAVGACSNRTPPPPLKGSVLQVGARDPVKPSSSSEPGSVSSQAPTNVQIEEQLWDALRLEGAFERPD